MSHAGKSRKKDAESWKGLGCVLWWEPLNSQESEMGCCAAGLAKEHHRRKAARTWLHVDSSARQDIGKNRYDLNLFTYMSLREVRRGLLVVLLPDLPFVSNCQTHNHTHFESMWAQSLSF